MIPAAFDIIRRVFWPVSFRCLRNTGMTRVMAGGHNLYPLMKLRIADGASLTCRT